MGNRMQLKGLGGFVGGFRFKFNGNEKLPIKKRKKKIEKENSKSAQTAKQNFPREVKLMHFD